LPVALVWVAACAAPSRAPVEESPMPPRESGPSPAPAPQAPAPQGQAPQQPPVKENVAIAGLVESARSDAAAGKLTTAAASLERALRIEPRNPRLWNELARVRSKQADYRQAENLAARSMQYAGNDNRLRADNWRIIAEAREASGDARGARAARDAAAGLER